MRPCSRGEIILKADCQRCGAERGTPRTRGEVWTGGGPPPSHQERQWAAQGMPAGEIAYRMSRKPPLSRSHGRNERRIGLRPGSDAD